MGVRKLKALAAGGGDSKLATNCPRFRAANVAGGARRVLQGAGQRQQDVGGAGEGRPGDPRQDARVAEAKVERNDQHARQDGRRRPPTRPPAIGTSSRAGVREARRRANGIGVPTNKEYRTWPSASNSSTQTCKGLPADRRGNPPRGSRPSAKPSKPRRRAVLSGAGRDKRRAAQPALRRFAVRTACSAGHTS